MTFGFAPQIGPRLQRPNLTPPAFPDADPQAQPQQTTPQMKSGQGGATQGGGQPASSGGWGPIGPQSYTNIQKILGRFGIGGNPQSPVDPTAPPVTQTGVQMPASADIGSSQPLTLGGVNYSGADAGAANAYDGSAEAAAGGAGGSIFSDIAALFGG